MINIQEKLNGKNINFLIGSGASFPIFKTLFLGENKLVTTAKRLGIHSHLKSIPSLALRSLI